MKALFLDRDGVINQKIENGYVLELSQLKFIDEFLDFYSILSKEFEYIFIVTNQRCIAKGLLSFEKLEEIHEVVLNKLSSIGKKVDKIYVCPHEVDECNCRKPKIGMGLFAKKDFPKIDFSKSVMIGDSESDILFAKNLGMLAVLYAKEKNYNADFTIYEYISRKRDFLL